ncbi:MAG: N-acetylneuraminate synthase [Lentisphaeria bacterium]|nr:N-acetylneuraminate synthase [Lentisphaeria bacterium]
MTIPVQKRCIIIAEAGVNHNGDLEMAKQLIKVAAEAGADYVKFQTFSADKLVTKTAKQAAYQKKNLQSGDDDSQYTMLKKLELSREAHEVLVKTCAYYGINFLSTAFDNENLVYLAKDLDLDFIKIPSGELTNYPYLRLAAQLNKPIILSTGMATLQEILDSVKLLEDFGVKKEGLYILHCTTEYPALISEVNLKAMDVIAEATGCQVGYSDHTMGIDVSVAAAARGAVVIEKHFTLDRSLPGPDHPASLEPDELKKMVIAIRNVQRAIGDGLKQPASARERGNRDVARKSIVAACPIKAGEIFTEENLATKRPGTGISPMKWPEVIGRKAKRDFMENDLIEL